MAKKNKNTYKPKTVEKEKKEKTFKNPANSIWGRIIIGILALAMCFGGLITLIYLIIQNR